VCTLGFDKPLRLARAVFLHLHLTTPNSVAGIRKRRGTVGPAQTPAPISSPVVLSRAFHLPTPPAPTPAHVPASLSVGVPSFTSPPPVPDADADDADSEDTEHDSDDVHIKSLSISMRIARGR
jgi:hypothetical protein